MQIFNLINKINLRKISKLVYFSSSDFKSNNNLNTNTNNKPTFINKIIKYNFKSIKILYKSSINNKYIRIIKSKKIKLIIKKLEKIYTNW